MAGATVGPSTAVDRVTESDRRGDNRWRLRSWRSVSLGDRKRAADMVIAGPTVQVVDATAANDGVVLALALNDVISV